jgi:hypothetical protein
MQVEHHHPMVALLDRLSGAALRHRTQHPADGTAGKRPQKLSAGVAMSLCLASVTGMHGASLLKEISDLANQKTASPHH